MLLQIDITRIILVYVIQGILAIFFSLIAFQIIRRNKQRFNLIFSGFFICITIGNLLNMIYAVLSDELMILILNFLTNFFIFFGTVFIFIGNMIILESTVIFSIKRQNRYIFYYGISLLIGMLVILIFFEGVTINPLGYPIWSPIFFIYVISLVSCFSIIPMIYTTLKIYFSFETKKLKRKWLNHLIGALGGISILYLILISNLLDNATYRSIISLVGISIVVWAFLMYRGIGFKLKRE